MSPYLLQIKLKKLKTSSLKIAYRKSFNLVQLTPKPLDPSLAKRLPPHSRE
ncbi:unnamed protein product [Spirodela intermedia]|uniref:Uncharacterized protein n=1 Tax=Spirodela intermedia TaxID=51605 RepID=A0A7I8JXH9_SPIIN|nr:unnamed protein product [Spirodela intermedia]